MFLRTYGTHCTRDCGWDTRNERQITMPKKRWWVWSWKLGPVTRQDKAIPQGACKRKRNESVRAHLHFFNSRQQRSSIPLNSQGSNGSTTSPITLQIVSVPQRPRYPLTYSPTSNPAFDILFGQLIICPVLPIEARPRVISVWTADALLTQRDFNVCTCRKET